jgi:hypothetical protein
LNISPVISLLLTNTVPLVRACLSILCEMFRGTQKEDDRGPLSVQSSLSRSVLRGGGGGQERTETAFYRLIRRGEVGGGGGSTNKKLRKAKCLGQFFHLSAGVVTASVVIFLAGKLIIVSK